jgi:hypothetical protein
MDCSPSTPKLDEETQRMMDEYKLREKALKSSISTFDNKV